MVVEVFNKNHRVYGTRKLKAVLNKMDIRISRRRIGKIMKFNGLESAYTVKKYKSQKSKVNESVEKKELNQEFNNRTLKEAIVSDLTYVRAGNIWNYICVIIDLYNRDIVGHSCGKHKDAKLICKAFSRIK